MSQQLNRRTERGPHTVSRSLTIIRGAGWGFRPPDIVYNARDRWRGHDARRAKDSFAVRSHAFATPPPAARFEVQRSRWRGKEHGPPRLDKPSVASISDGTRHRDHVVSGTSGLSGRWRRIPRPNMRSWKRSAEKRPSSSKTPRLVPNFRRCRCSSRPSAAAEALDISEDATSSSAGCHDHPARTRQRRREADLRRHHGLTDPNTPGETGQVIPPTDRSLTRTTRARQRACSAVHLTWRPRHRGAARRRRRRLHRLGRLRCDGHNTVTLDGQGSGTRSAFEGVMKNGRRGTNLIQRKYSACSHTTTKSAEAQEQRTGLLLNATTQQINAVSSRQSGSRQGLSASTSTSSLPQSTATT